MKPELATTAAIVTPSYAGDLERCRLLCETLDRHARGYSVHYILVEHHDLPLFRQFAGPRREIVDERALLPDWLHSVPDPLSRFKRRIWLSFRTRPLRGWHVQQLRRIAIAEAVSDLALVYVDSDVAFLRDFDCADMWRDGDLRLLRRDDALLLRPSAAHDGWSVQAARLLGIEPVASPHDYIGTLIAWRRDAVLGMIDRIEAVSGRHWVEAIGQSRQFSECMIYGRYVDEVLGGLGHFADSTEFCRVYWSDPAPDEAGLRDFIGRMAPAQVAVGMQSFLGTDLAQLRRVIGA